MTARTAKEINNEITDLESQLYQIKVKRKGIADWANALPTMGRRANRAFENMKSQTFKQEQELKRSLHSLKVELAATKKSNSSKDKNNETEVSEGETKNGK